MLRVEVIDFTHLFLVGIIKAIAGLKFDLRLTARIVWLWFAAEVSPERTVRAWT